MKLGSRGVSWISHSPEFVEVELRMEAGSAHSKARLLLDQHDK